MTARPFIGALLLLLVMSAAALAHDLFLKPDQFRIAPNAAARIRLLNGTFTESEAAVAWNRVADASLTGPDRRISLDSTTWLVRGDTSFLTVRVAGPGTYVVGVSVKPRVLRLEAAAFNEYLKTDGVPDILERRRTQGELDRPARERYSKHVKTLLQAGNATGNIGAPLGYPAELVPLENPYDLRVGAALRVRALVDGQPVGNQFIMAGGRNPTGARLPVFTTRTDTNGVARIPLRAAGAWYVKFIRMVPVSADTAVDYESKWATLTFEIR